ncbi:hypothetical protein CR513_18234, partial [Mucuna pruriens]
MFEALFPFSHNGCSNRSSHSTSVAKTRIGRKNDCLVELSEFEPKGVVKSKASLNPKGGGADIILEGSGQVVLEHSLKFDFKISNDEVEYKVLLAGLSLALEVDARKVLCNSDS